MSRTVEHSIKIGGQERKFYCRAGTTDEIVYAQTLTERAHLGWPDALPAYDLRRLQRGKHPGRQLDLQRFLEQRRASGKRPLVIDAGANIGASSVFFADRVPGSIVIAIEPEAENFKLLQQNVAGLDIQPVRGAVSATQGRMALIDPGDGAWAYRTAEASGSANTVPRFTINDMYRQCAAQCFPFIVKVDIEGGEADLFSTNTDWIARTPLLIVELHDWMLPKGRTSRPFLQCISQLDRDFVYVGEDIYSIANDLDALV